MCVPSQPSVRSKFCSMMSPPQADLPNQDGTSDGAPWNDLDRCAGSSCTCQPNRSKDRRIADRDADCICRRVLEDGDSWRMIGLKLRMLADDFECSRRTDTQCSTAIFTRSLAAVSGALSAVVSSCLRLF